MPAIGAAVGKKMTPSAHAQLVRGVFEIQYVFMRLRDSHEVSLLGPQALAENVSPRLTEQCTLHRSVHAWIEHEEFEAFWHKYLQHVGPFPHKDVAMSLGELQEAAQLSGLQPSLSGPLSGPRLRPCLRKNTGNLYRE